jgi:hypothetical protein
MKTMTKFASILILLFLVSPALLLSGCGADVAKSQGCPSGSFLANPTDVIIGPADVTFEEAALVGSVFGGGPISFPPITFRVVDEDGIPRNNICLSLYTGDSVSTTGGPFWFTDLTYGTIFNGTGPLNYRTVATNDSGVAILYWWTAVLPAGLPRTLTTPPSTFTAGADQKGTSFIRADSGTQSVIFNAIWTVKGEPAL